MGKFVWKSSEIKYKVGKYLTYSGYGLNVVGGLTGIYFDFWMIAKSIVSICHQITGNGSIAMTALWFMALVLTAMLSCFIPLVFGYLLGRLPLKYGQKLCKDAIYQSRYKN